MNIRNSTLLFLYCLMPLFALAQGPDCSQAGVICSSGAIDFNPSGPGINDFANPNNNDGCLTGEHQSVWYYFAFQPTMPPNSIIEFVINPNAGPGQDYDFAIFGPNVDCDMLGAPIRCSYAGSACGFCPQTGLGMGTSDVSEGAGGDGFVAAMTVQPGQGYYLLIDNFISSSSGFSLNWSGSAAPFLDCTVNPNCDLFVDAGPNQTICVGAPPIQLQGSAPGAVNSPTYSWTGTNGGTNFLSNPFSPNPLVLLPPNFTGSITYTLTVNDDPCVESDVVTITVAPPPTVNIAGDLTICQGQTSILSATGIGITSYTWNTGATTSTLPVTQTGTYSVTVTNASGCTATASVNVTPEPGPMPIITGDFDVCVGGAAVITANPGFATYQWSTGSNSMATVVNLPGTYSVTVTNALGCFGSATVNVFPEPPPVVNIAGNTSLCSGGNATLSATLGFAAYQWSNNATSPAITVTTPGTYAVTVMTTAGCQGTAQVQVTNAPSPNPSISGALTICPGSSTTLTVQGGPFSSVLWSNNAVTNSINVNTPGTYSVTVTNVFNCSATASVTVSQNATPTANISGDLTICPGQSTTLDAGTGFTSYLWSNSSIGQTLTTSTPGTYSVTVTGPNGCTGSGSATVTALQPPSPTITGDLDICPEDTGTLSVGAYNSYLWSTGAATPTISVSGPGNIGVTVTDANGCQGTDTAVVNEFASPTPNIVGALQICTNTGSTTLSVDGTYNSYLWSNSLTTDSIAVTATGNYSVTVTDGNGCEGTDVVNVGNYPVPMPSITGDLAICQGESATLGVTPAYNAYLWSTSDTTSTITLNSSGTFSVTVTDSNGCFGQTSAALTVNNLPVVNITGDNGICQGESSTLNAGSGFSTYSWSNAGDGPTITVNTGGTYAVTVTDANGCSNSDDIEVTQFSQPTVQISGELSYCIGGQTTLTGTPGFTAYLWSTTATTPTLTVNTPGAYSLTVTDANGCTASQSVNVVQLTELMPSISGVLSICPGDNTTLSVNAGFASYSWSNGSTNSQISVSTPNTYSVTVTDAFGCSGNTSVSVSQFVPPSPQITGALSFCTNTSTQLAVPGNYVDYLWSNSDTTSQITVTTAGNFSVTVTDANGCEGSTSVNVTALALPAPVITGALNFCPGTSTTLSVGNNFSTYNWSSGSTTNSSTVNSPGAYSVTVTDANGCVGTDDAVLANFNTAVPNITGATQFCPGTNTTLSAQGAFVSYAWSNNQNTPAITITTPGNYSVTATDANGCITTNNVNTALYTVSPPVITGPAEFCSEQSIQLDAGAGYTAYSWSNNGAGQTITVVDGGDYSVTVTDVNGCISSATVGIVENDLPEVTIGGSSTFCIGGFTTLNAGGTYSSYQWSNNTGDPTLVVNTPGQYGLTVTDANGCSGSASINVIQATELSPVVTGDLAFCENGSTTLSVGIGFATYLWSTGAITPSITVNTPGSYSVSVSDASGCNGDTEVMVVENALPTPIIGGVPSFCEGASTTLNAGSGYDDYVWSTGSLNQQITALTPGAYSVTVTDFNGCSASASVIVVENQLPDFDISGQTFFCVGSSTALSATPGFAAYQWSNGDLDANTDISQGGSYSLTVTNSFGCSDVQSILINPVSLPIADAGGNSVIDCNNSSVTLGGSGSSTGAQYEYNWSGPGINANNGSQANPVVFQAGNYVLIVVDTLHQCQSLPSSTGVTDLTQEPVAVANALAELTCTVNNVSISGAGSATGSTISYQWFDALGNPIPGATNLNFTATVAQQFTLEVTDNSTGCSNTASATVVEDRQLPTAEAGLPQLINCYSPSVTLDGGASSTGDSYTYTWTNASGQIIYSGPNPFVSVNQPGAYSLSVLNTDNGCEQSDAVAVTQDITPPVAAAGADQELNCVSPQVTLNGSLSSAGPQFTYEWQVAFLQTPFATTTVVQTDQPGTYTLLVTNVNNGCTATDQVVVELNPDRPTDAALAVDGPTCFGDTDGSIVIQAVTGGQSPYLYNVNGAGFVSQSAFPQLGAGVYNIVIQDAIGCEYATEVFIPEGNDLMLDLGEDQYIDLGDDANLRATFNIDPSQVAQFQWGENDFFDCMDCLEHQISPLQTVTFTGSLVDLNGCSTTDRVTVYVDKTRNIFVPNAFSPDGDGINDRLLIFSDQDVSVVRSFLIFNRWGESVFEVYNFPTNDPAYGWDGTFRSRLYNANVFVWFAEVEFIDGEVVLFKGDVTLMR